MRVVEHFDHFVLPVDDIVAAEEFYAAVSSAASPATRGENR